jgi:hypothetical protein
MKSFAHDVGSIFQPILTYRGLALGLLLWLHPELRGRDCPVDDRDHGVSPPSPSRARSR